VRIGFNDPIRINGDPTDVEDRLDEANTDLPVRVVRGSLQMDAERGNTFTFQLCAASSPEVGSAADAGAARFTYQIPLGIVTGDGGEKLFNTAFCVGESCSNVYYGSFDEVRRLASYVASYGNRSSSDQMRLLVPAILRQREDVAGGSARATVHPDTFRVSPGLRASLFGGGRDACNMALPFGLDDLNVEDELRAPSDLLSFHGLGTNRLVFEGSAAADDMRFALDDTARIASVILDRLDAKVGEMTYAAATTAITSIFGDDVWRVWLVAAVSETEGTDGPEEVIRELRAARVRFDKNSHVFTVEISRRNVRVYRDSSGKSELISDDGIMFSCVGENRD